MVNQGRVLKKKSRHLIKIDKMSRVESNKKEYRYKMMKKLLNRCSEKRRNNSPEV